MPARKKQSNAPPLARPATVVRYRRNVTDRGNREAGRLQRTQRRLTSRARARHLDFEGAHAVLLRLLRHVFGRDLRGNNDLLILTQPDAVPLVVMSLR